MDEHPSGRGTPRRSFKGASQPVHLPGDLADEGLQLLGFKGSGQGPAHVAGGVAHVDADAAGAPLFVVRHGLDDERHHCKRATGKRERRRNSFDRSKAPIRLIVFFKHRTCCVWTFTEACKCHEGAAEV